jgi:hypothetical protein
VASIALLVIAVWVAGAPAAAAFWTVLRSLASGVTSAPETPVPRLVRTGDTDLPREVRAPEPAGPAAPVREKAPANLVALEIEALWRLHQVGALAGDDIAVRRDGRGLSIEARVDTPERKAGLQRALSSLADAGVHVRVETFQEIADRAGSPSPRVVVQDLVAVADTAPAAALLAAHFAAQFGSASDERIPGAARDFSRRVLQQARHATLGVFALRRICEGVPPAALEEAGGAARVTHQVLVREYAGAIEAAGAALVRDLQTVFPPPADPVEAPDQLSLQALTTSASRLEEGLQHAFAVQAGGAAPPLPDGRHLLGLARGVERAAGRIRQHTCQ